MELDNRSVQILQAIAVNLKITSKNLMEKYDLTRNQIDYSIKKINEYLIDRHYEPIVRSRNGFFVVNEKVIDDFSGVTNNESQLKADETSFLDEEYRMLVILLLIFSEEYLSLFHFSDALEVSKNTIVSDIKKLKNYLERLEIRIIYNRKDGYRFKGNEESIRGMVLTVIDKVTESIYSKVIFETYLGIASEEITHKQNLLSQIEKELEVFYTDNRIQIAPLFLILLDRRVQNGHLLEERFGENAKEILDTNEYAIVAKVLVGKKLLPSNFAEHLYLCLFILSLKITNSNNIFSLDIQLLRHCIERFIDDLEKNTVLLLNDKERLVENLLLHLTPAYYRIKYRLTSEFDLNDVVKSQLDSLFFIVKSSVKPLEDFFGEKIPNNEIYLITMFISAYMQKEKPINLNNTVVKAAVVCPNGIISSKLLENTLDSWFPTIQFLDSLSIREFYQKEATLNVQLVFSTTPLTTNLPVIVVGNDLSDMNKTLVVNEVVRLVYQIDSYKLQPDQILSLVKKHVNLDSDVEEKIRKELMISYNSIFQIQDQEVLTNEVKLNLSDVITEDSVVILPNKKISWASVLTIATENLIQREIVEQRYLDQMLMQFPEVLPNIVLGESIVIPHTMPENGAKKLGMSLVKVPGGFTSNQKEYKYVVAISAVDKHRHIQPMMQLLKIASSKETLKRLDDSQTAKEIIDILTELKK